MTEADIIAVIADWGEISFPHLCEVLECHPDDTGADVIQGHVQNLLTRGVLYLDGRYYGVADV